MPPNNQIFSSNSNTPVPSVAPTPPTPPTPAPGISAVTSGSAENAQTRPIPKNPNSTQNSLLFSEIRDNMVIMLDGSFRAVIACKSINFDLMSSSEREGVEYSYQNFLNSLNHPIQILVRSQRVDIGPYIVRLSDIRRNQDNMLLGVLMDDYINFISDISQQASIMNKSFFLVIPYFPGGDAENLVAQSKNFFSAIFGKNKNTITKIDAATYQKAKDEIKNRVGSVTSGLFQLGVQAVQLETKELGELYYNFYNPDTAVREPLGNFEDIATTYVKKGVEINSAMAAELRKTS